MIFVFSIFTIGQVKNDCKLLVIFGVQGNEECQDKNRRTYEVTFSFN